MPPLHHTLVTSRHVSTHIIMGYDPTGISSVAVSPDSCCCKFGWGLTVSSFTHLHKATYWMTDDRCMWVIEVFFKLASASLLSIRSKDTQLSAPGRDKTVAVTVKQCWQRGGSSRWFFEDSSSTPLDCSLPSEAQEGTLPSNVLNVADVVFEKKKKSLDQIDSFPLSQHKE